MAKKILTEDTWKHIKAEWESDHRVTYTTLAAKYGVGKATISDRARKGGWEKQVDHLAITTDANLRADAACDPAGGRTDRAHNPNTSEALKRRAANDEAAEKRANILVKHREEAVRFDQLQSATLSLLVKALQTRDTQDWWLAMKAADTLKSQVTTAKLKQEMERGAWGLDVVIDPRSLTLMTDEQLEAIVAGKMPWG
jgi:hypothetical protein